MGNVGEKEVGQVDQKERRGKKKKKKERERERERCFLSYIGAGANLQTKNYRVFKKRSVSRPSYPSLGLSKGGSLSFQSF